MTWRGVLGKAGVAGMLLATGCSAPAGAQALAPYQGYLLSTPVALGATDADWSFSTGDANRDGALDVFAVKRHGASGTTEVHVLDGARSYQAFLAQTPTALHPTDASWDFSVADYDHDGVLDLWAFARAGTGSHTTEVHVLDGASGYQRFIAHAATALHETPGGWSFTTGDVNRDGNVDVIGVLHAGASRSTEVHVLDGAAGWGRFLLQTATPLAVTDDSWDFGAADANRDGAVDVFAIDRMDPATNRTGVHVLDGAGGFGRFASQTATVLGPTDGAWSFVPADFSHDGTADVLAFHRSAQTSVAILDGAQRPVPPPDQGPSRCGAADAFRVTAKLRRRVAGFTAHPLVSGRLTRPDGTPVGGTTVEITTGRSTFAPVGTAVTAADGTWSFALPQGPTRSVFAAVSDGDATPVCSPVLRQRVRGAATVRAVHRTVRVGRRAVFTGRVKGAPLPRRGKLVGLQGYDKRRHRWVPVATTRTRAGGAFKLRFRFVAATRPSTFRFRVRLFAEAGYPYAEATSRVVRVRARPR
jgi:FG-GAP-like repeat